MKIHTGDTVLVIAGKDRGKQGRVIRTLPAKNRVVVEGINMRTRHIKKTNQGPGQRIKYEAGLSVSNVMIIDPKTKKPTRIGYKVDAKGKKVRIARISGEVLPIVSTAKAVDTTKKAKKTTKATKAKGEEKEVVKEEAKVAKTETAAKPAGPARQPFWKRAFTGPDAEKGEAGTSAPEPAHDHTKQIHRSNRES